MKWLGVLVIRTLKGGVEMRIRNWSDGLAFALMMVALGMLTAAVTRIALAALGFGR